MTEPVSPPYKLPPEVLALLGDDATPECAIAAANRGTATYVDNLKQPDGDDNDARFAWYGMLAAAAIRECEARRKHTELSDLCGDVVMTATKQEMVQLAAKRDESLHEMRSAIEAYEALRQWRKP